MRSNKVCYRRFHELAGTDKPQEVEMKAEIGDKGDFVFGGGNRIFGEILYMPQATGDCWIVKETDSGGSIVYIQTFECMYLRGKVGL